MAKKRNDLPFDSVKILYADYDIIGVSDRDAGRREIMGQFFSKEQEIDYDLGLPDTEKVNTIMHEIGHGICHTMGIKFKSADDGEEEFVNTYTAGLITVLRDNPLLTKWLTETLHPDLVRFKNEK